MKKLYLSGPMSGIPQGNFPLFDKATRELRAAGFIIISPAELDDKATRLAALNNEPCPHTWGELLGRDVQVIADVCDGIIFLPEWWKSRGARLETLAAILTGKDIFGYYVDNSTGDLIRWIASSDVCEILRENIP